MLGVILFSTFPSCLLIFWSLYRYQMLHVVPIARNKLVEIMKEGIIVLDTQQQVIDYNVSAVRLIVRAGGERDKDWHGMPLSALLPDTAPWSAAHACREETEMELCIPQSGKDDVWLAVTVTPLISGGSSFYGSLSVISDISEAKKLEMDLRRRATRDGLTGIYNRSGFMERAQRHLSLCVDADEPFSLLVLDLDLFKQINDCYGHSSGDLALRTFVESVLTVVEGEVLFGRIGGEEFAIALPGLDIQRAAWMAEQIRSQ